MLNRAFSIKRAVCTGVLLLVALCGFLSLNRVRSKAFDIVTDTLPGLTDASLANSDSGEDVNFILLALMAPTPEQRAKLCAQADAFEADAAKYLKLYEESIFQEQDRANFSRTMDRRRAFIELRGEVLALMQRGEDKQALAKYKQELLPSYSQYISEARALLEYNIQEGQARGKSILRFSSLTQYAVAAFTIALFILGFVVGVFNLDPVPSRPRRTAGSKPVHLEARLSKVER
ncbi:MAG TPA: MCP four helix bundle domain-containing protein [Verrucomicrobiae bacterium]|nr:MCP four helix bundle domain-containing protein [Verrucomicrobiae bacterium]